VIAAAHRGFPVASAASVRLTAGRAEVGAYDMRLRAGEGGALFVSLRRRGGQIRGHDEYAFDRGDIAAIAAAAARPAARRVRHGRRWARFPSI
jgi:hypothetical protein